MGRKNKHKSAFGGKHLFLYGKLSNQKVYGYCKYHCCSLSQEDLKIKNCKKKNCRHLTLK